MMLNVTYETPLKVELKRFFFFFYISWLHFFGLGLLFF